MNYPDEIAVLGIDCVSDLCATPTWSGAEDGAPDCDVRASVQWIGSTGSASGWYASIHGRAGGWTVEGPTRSTPELAAEGLAKLVGDLARRSGR